MSRVVKSRHWGRALARIVFAAACLAGAFQTIPAPSGGLFLAGCGLLFIGVTLLCAPAFAKEGT